jgi:hypothetical protein
VRKANARAGPGTEALQRRMKVGAAGDRFEREADRIADHVVGPSALPAAALPPVISPLTVQRNVLDEERETAGPEEPAQRKAGPEAPAKEDELDKALKGVETAQRSMRGTGQETPKAEDELSKALDAQRDAKGPGARGGTAPASVESSIQAMRSGPAPGLSAPLRSRMENKMGVELGGARLHSGAAAGRAADALNARAFTVGQDMFFGRGQYDPGSTAGQRLIAHEAAHTVQQRGGSAGVQRIQRATAKGKSQTKADDKTGDTTTIDKLEGNNWAVDFTAPDGHSGTITLPKLELPNVGGTLKGAAGGKASPVADAGRSLPAAGAPFKLDPVPARSEGKAFETWYNYAKTNFTGPAKTALDTQIKAQGNAAPMRKGNRDVYVLYTGKKAESSKTALIGTTDELSKHDSLLRPMLSPKGADASLDADHILELQVGGQDSAENMWLLKSKYNRSVGSSIKSRIDRSISGTLKDAARELKKTKGAVTPKAIPGNATEVKRSWVLRFKTVKAGKFGTTTTFWTKAQMRAGEQVKHFKAMTEKELVRQGFVFKEGEVPKFINVFPDATGGRVARFTVSDDGKKLKKPSFFYRGIYILEDAPFTPPTAGTKNSIISTLRVRRTKKQSKDSDVIVAAEKTIDLKHDENLGFGAHISRDSIATAFRNMKFTPLSPITFANVSVTPDGALFAEGSILSSKALLPQLNVPIILRGDSIYVNFPIPAERLKFGPVSVTEAALQLGVSEGDFFIAGSAGIAIEKLGRGTLSAKTTKKDSVISGKFAFDFNFVENAEVDAEYSLAKDDFKAKGTLTVKKGTLPGVESGTIEINATRQTFGVTGTLQLGGVLTGSSITVGYDPETGLLIEGKDIPLPVDKLPGVSDAKVTVRAQRSPDTGEWIVRGAGSAALKAPGAIGNLKIAVKGEQVYFDGRVDLAKGPAKGFIQVTATNLQMDENGKPIEGGLVGPLQIWGQGQATIAFGKVLTGMAGIEYTREGNIIITGEIALPPTVDLFKKVEYEKRLLKITPPDFPIWGVKLGPVGIGIFAFVDARLDFFAYVGPGQLRDTKVNAKIDLDKPSEATVEGKAQFYVPAYAGFKLDLGGGLKAQVAVAYVKGRVGLDGTLGLGVEGKIDVGVKWNVSDGLAFNANANVKASPKFELGVNASVTAGVDLPWPLSDIDHTWGPWRKKLGEFGPNMELSADFPMAWSEKNGLDFDINKIRVTKPQLDAKGLMKSAFDTLV